MQQSLELYNSNEDTGGVSWGNASKKRGIAHLELAIEFVTQFPIGTTMTVENFDAWAQHRGLLNTPPQGTPKESDAWKAHLMRRHELRYKIRNAGSHPRLRNHGSTPFSFDAISQGIYQVRAPHVAATHSGIPARIASLITTKRKQLAHLMQSANWDQLPPYERAFGETLYDDIDAMNDRVSAEATLLERKFAKLENRLQKLKQNGVIKLEHHADVEFEATD